MDIVIERAYRAAMSGRTADLDAALAELRRIDPAEAFLIADRLRSLSRSVASHPSGAGSAGRRAS